jgi:hypothetical protein
MTQGQYQGVWVRMATRGAVIPNFLLIFRSLRTMDPSAEKKKPP